MAPAAGPIAAIHRRLDKRLSERQYAVRCIRLGAAGYLHKGADPDDMLAAVRKAAAGGVYLSSAAAEALAAAVGRHGARPGTDALSHREHQVLRLLTSGHSVGEIGAQLGLAANTVRTYRARILEKTGTKHRRIRRDPLPPTRTRAELHHLDGYYELRNHIVDFLVSRARAH